MSTPNNAKVWYNYGNYLRDQEVKETAATCYKEAVRLWPDYVIALNNLATGDPILSLPNHAVRHRIQHPRKKQT